MERSKTNIGEISFYQGGEQKRNYLELNGGSCKIPTFLYIFDPGRRNYLPGKIIGEFQKNKLVFSQYETEKYLISQISQKGLFQTDILPKNYNLVFDERFLPGNFSKILGLEDLVELVSSKTIKGPCLGAVVGNLRVRENLRKQKRVWL